MGSSTGRPAVDPLAMLPDQVRVRVAPRRFAAASGRGLTASLFRAAPALSGRRAVPRIRPASGGSN